MNIIYLILIISLTIISLILFIFAYLKKIMEGNQGFQGEKGDRGPQGDRGPSSGEKGDTGITGPDGPQGIQGITGENGTGNYVTIYYENNFMEQKNPSWYYENYEKKIVNEFADISFYTEHNSQGVAIITTYNDILQIWYGRNNDASNSKIQVRISKDSNTWSSWTTII